MKKGLGNELGYLILDLTLDLNCYLINDLMLDLTLDLIRYLTLDLINDLKLDIQLTYNNNIG